MKKGCRPNSFRWGRWEEEGGAWTEGPLPGGISNILNEEFMGKGKSKSEENRGTGRKEEEISPKRKLVRSEVARRRKRGKSLLEVYQGGGDAEG